MIRTVLCVMMILVVHILMAQEQGSPDPVYQQQLEDLAEKQDAENKDDAYWQDLDESRAHPLNLNTASPEDLAALHICNEIQVHAFFVYRDLLGLILDKYELQAVPGWDVALIVRLLPYISIGNEHSLIENLHDRLVGGQSSLILRSGEQLEKSKGFEQPPDSAASHYAGSRQRIFLRYKYNDKNLLQYGFLGDKDAGEQFFKGSQPAGFDFYSFHAFAKNAGIFKSLALGDFTVNMGQGLIQWQTLAFTKSADVLAVKRQSAVLRAYNSAGEFNFHRGAGVTIKKGIWETTAFISFRKISANFNTDTSGRDEVVSSFENSGYHRTASEIEDKNDLEQTSYGFNITLEKRNYRIGLNAIAYRFSKAIRKRDEPYNLFALQGRSWTNASIDYSYTFRNIHFFGEAAADKNFNKGLVNGLLISLNAVADAAVVYRNTGRAFQSLYANAFTDNISPGNENGWYIGFSVRPYPGWKVDAFMDSYANPWLKYKVNGPGRGADILTAINYQPGKTWNIFARFKTGRKLQNRITDSAAIPGLSEVSRQECRFGYEIRLTKQFRVRNIVAMVWYDQAKPDHETGFSWSMDVFYKPLFKPVSGNIRVQYFETGGYNSRIFGFENDVLYHFSIPFLYNKGFRYYINADANLKKALGLARVFKSGVRVSAKWAQTRYPAKIMVGSGLDEIISNRKSDFTVQLFLSW